MRRVVMPALFMIGLCSVCPSFFHPCANNVPWAKWFDDEEDSPADADGEPGEDDADGDDHAVPRALGAALAADFVDDDHEGVE